LSRLAWPAVALCLVGPAWWLGWQPDASSSPWALRPALAWHAPGWLASLWTAAWVHASPAHLLMNVCGAIAVAMAGWALAMPARGALAWLLSWPLCHLLMFVDDRVAWYVGASGVLHAGVALLAVQAWRTWGRVAGGSLLLMLAVKLCLDVSAGFPLAERASMGITVVTLSHLIGTLCGLFLAGFLPSRFP